MRVPRVLQQWWRSLVSLFDRAVDLLVGPSRVRYERTYTTTSSRPLTQAEWEQLAHIFAEMDKLFNSIRSKP